MDHEYPIIPQKITLHDLLYHIGVFVLLGISFYSLYNFSSLIYEIKFGRWASGGALLGLGSGTSPYGGAKVSLFVFFSTFLAYLLTSSFLLKKEIKDYTGRSTVIRKRFSGFMRAMSLVSLILFLISSTLVFITLSYKPLLGVPFAVIAGFIYSYYSYDRKLGPIHGQGRLYFALCGIILAVFVFIGWLINIGPLGTEEMKKLDEKQVKSLDLIENFVATLWKTTGKLPQVLNESKIGLLFIPVDIETGKPYHYEITGVRSFKICAKFHFPSLQYPKIISHDQNQNWQHGAGETCFNRNINSEQGFLKTTQLMEIAQRRMLDMSRILFEVVNYWQQTKKLPKALSDIKGSLKNGFILPQDPVTKNPYEYTTTSPLSFRLCAIFDQRISSSTTYTTTSHSGYPYDAFGATIVDDMQDGTRRACLDKTLSPKDNLPSKAK